MVGNCCLNRKLQRAAHNLSDSKTIQKFLSMKPFFAQLEHVCNSCDVHIFSLISFTCILLHHSALRMRKAISANWWINPLLCLPPPTPPHPTPHQHHVGHSQSDSAVAYCRGTLQWTRLQCWKNTLTFYILQVKGGLWCTHIQCTILSRVLLARCIFCWPTRDSEWFIPVLTECFCRESLSHRLPQLMHAQKQPKFGD